MAVFREYMDLNVRFYFQNPQKAHPFLRDGQYGASAVGERKNQKTNKKQKTNIFEITYLLHVVW